MFTDRQIAALKPRDDRYEVWDGDGFGVRVTPKGAKSFVWMYRFGGTARRMTLGAYNPPHFGVADANLKLAEAKKLHKAGKDPGRELVEQKREERQAETIADLVKEYLASPMKPRAEDERIINKDVLPRWRRTKVKDVTRRDVVKLVNEVVGRGAPIQANRTLTAVRKLFRYAVEQAIIDLSPVSEIGRQKETPRDRCLNEAEIFVALDAIRTFLEPTMADGLELMFSTGVRKAEAFGLHQSEIDFGRRVWLLPAARSKNRRAHLIPLNDRGLAILTRRKPNEAGWYFPSPSTGEPYLGNSIDHAVRALFAVRDTNRHRRKGPARKPRLTPLADLMPPWTPHDIRRSVTTLMREHGVPREHVKAVLNHAAGDVTGRYDLYDMLAEKRAALAILGAQLDRITSGGSNVVPLAKAS